MKLSILFVGVIVTSGFRVGLQQKWTSMWPFRCKWREIVVKSYIHIYIYSKTWVNDHLAWATTLTWATVFSCTESFMGSELNASDIFWLPQFLETLHLRCKHVQSHLWNCDATLVSPWFDDDVNLLGAIAVKCDEMPQISCLFETHLTPIIQFVRYISWILQTWQNDRIWRLFVFWFHQKYFTTIYGWAVMNAYNRVDFEFPVAISASLPSATTFLERPHLLGPLGGRYIQVLPYIYIYIYITFNYITLLFQTYYKIWYRWFMKNVFNWYRIYSTKHESIDMISLITVQGRS